MMVRHYQRKTADRWTREDLQRALTMITVEKCKTNDVARQFGISRATLYRQTQKIKNGLLSIDDLGSRSTIREGRRVLTNMEEQVLENTVIDLKNQGFVVTSLDIKRICFEYCHANDIANQFEESGRRASDDWYYGFIKRHPILKRYAESSSDESSADDDVTKTNEADDPDSSPELVAESKKRYAKRQPAASRSSSAPKPKRRNTGVRRKIKVEAIERHNDGEVQESDIKEESEPSVQYTEEAMPELKREDNYQVENEIKSELSETQEDIDVDGGVIQGAEDASGEIEMEHCNEPKDVEVGREDAECENVEPIADVVFV
jgi:transposase-like protein